jgi:hypothetical protein
VEKGLRASLKSGSLLTGQLFVDLDFQKDAAPATCGDIGKLPSAADRSSCRLRRTTRESCGDARQIQGAAGGKDSQQRHAAEKLFDGCYIVSGEVPKDKMAASEVVASYKKLGLVEEAFRSLKTVQLEVRPVYHKTDDRIRSHVLLCTLAYYLQWHLKQRLEPLFATDGTHKDRQWTVRNVIERLAAIRRDKIAMGTLEFEKVTTPEPDQQTILDYLKVRL